MGLATFAELKTSLGDWLNRSDLTAVIPDFITLAEAQMNRDVRHYSMMQRDTATIDSQFSASPNDWLETVRLHLNDATKTLLEQTSPEEIAKKRELASDTAGKPEFFCHIGNTYEVFPTPSTSQTAELLYYQKIPALSDSNTSNWLLQTSPDMYLYGALLQASPYLVNDERLGTWGNLYQSALNSTNGASDQSRYSSAGLKLQIRSY